MNKNEIVLKTIESSNANGMLLISEVNRYWFTNIKTSLGFVLINKIGKKIFITDTRYILLAKNNLKDFDDVICINSSPGMNPRELIYKYCKEMEIDNILVEKEYFKLSDLELLSEMKYELFNSKDLRIIKSEEEIQKLKKSADILTETVNWVLTWIKPGISEKEVAKKIAIKFIELGATKNSFDTIVAAGINGSYPHHQPTDYIIQDGDMVTIDCGCMYDSFASDMTRTFVVGTKCNNDEMIKIYETVKKSQALGLEKSIIGNTTFEVDKACRDFIDSTEYKGLFGHGTGHGVGMEVHELPVVSPNVNIELKNNHVITVEPGIYKANVGGVRIEDTIVIHNNKPLILTNKCTKDLLFINNK
ncbi:MAG: M24 family metallopeptidase [Mycoplasma sp.]